MYLAGLSMVSVSSYLSLTEPCCLSESRSLSVPSPAANTTTEPQYDIVVCMCVLVDIMVTHTQGKMVKQCGVVAVLSKHPCM